MSQENVELAYRLYDAVSRRDLDALLAVTDENVELISILVSVEGGYHGQAGFRRRWENGFDAIPNYRTEVEEIRDLGDLTLAAIRLRGHGACSVAATEQRLLKVLQ